MKVISNKESEIGNLLNEKRVESYVDIYMETEFLGRGYLIDKDLYLYKYGWGYMFNKANHEFGMKYELLKSENTVSYEMIEDYLIKELNIVEKEYKESVDDEKSSCEIIKLKSFIKEFNNNELYDLIQEKIEKDLVKIA